MPSYRNSMFATCITSDSEVIHVANIEHYDREKAWRPDGDNKRPFKELVVDLLFFDQLHTRHNNTANAVE